MIRIRVKAYPKSSSAGISGFADGKLKVRLCSPPEKGRANRELVDVVADKLGVARSAVLIVKGDRGREKLIEIQGISEKEFMERIVK